MPPNCVREERATREAYGLVGNEKELPRDMGVSWCGERMSGVLFVSADHALRTLMLGGGREPCRNCLREMRDIITIELDGLVMALGSQPQSLRDRVAEFERGLVRDMLAATNGNQSETARRLKMHRSVLHYKIRKFDL